MTVPLSDPRAGAARGLRALVLSLVAVGIAGTAHTVVDGCVDGGGLVVALGLCWPGAVAVLGRRRPGPALLLWTAAAQVLTHLVLALTCGGPVHAAPGRVVLVHTAAVLVTSLVLARADAALWAADAVRRALARLLLPTATVVPVVVRPVPAPTPVPLPRARWRVSPQVLRGPPSVATP